MSSGDVRYRGSWFEVGEFRCRSGSPALGPEEASDADEVVLLRSGFFVKQVGRRRLVADANHVVFFNNDEPYRVSHPSGTGDCCLVVRLAPAPLRELLETHDPGAAGHARARFRATHAPCSTAAYVLQERLHRLLGRAGAEALEVEELTLALLDACLGQGGSALGAPAPLRDATRARHRDTAEAVKELVSTRLRESPALQAIAREVGAAPFHLARLFRREVGLPIHRYRLRLRLRAALTRLAQGESDLAALALDLGFSDHAHLTRAFGVEFGLTPSRWRALGVSALGRTPPAAATLRPRPRCAPAPGGGR